MSAWVPIVVAVIGGPMMWFLSRFDRRNTEQHNQNMGVLRRVESKVDRLDEKSDHLDAKIDRMHDRVAHLERTRPSKRTPKSE